MGRRRGRDGAKEAYWREQVARQAESGRSVRGYCLAAGVSESRFHWWRRELRRRDGTSPRGEAKARAPMAQAALAAPIRLAEVVVGPGSSAAPVEGLGSEGAWSGVEVRLDRGVALRLAVGFDEGTLRRALAALRAGARGC
jgi:transposase-like protein